MSRSDHTFMAGRVHLLDVIEGILEELLDVARTDAAPDDVTPPLGETDGWNPERLGWFRDYHRSAAADWTGPAAQKSWAISCDGQIVGSIRLKRPGTAPSEGGLLEAGLWLGRSFRGRGIGHEALTLVCDVASGAGASMLLAETTCGNKAAQALLRAAGAGLAGDSVAREGAAEDSLGSPVTARINLRFHGREGHCGVAILTAAVDPSAGSRRTCPCVRRRRPASFESALPWRSRSAPRFARIPVGRRLGDSKRIAGPLGQPSALPLNEGQRRGLGSAGRDRGDQRDERIT